MKTFSKVMSLIVMRWCGSMSQYGMYTVCCAEHSTQLNFNLPGDGHRPKHVGFT